MAIEYSQVANPTINKSFRGQDINFKINDAQLPSRNKSQIQMQVVKATNQAALQSRTMTPKPQMRNILDHKLKYEEDCCCEDGSLDNITYRDPQTQFNKTNKATIATLQDIKLNKGTAKLNYQTQKAMAMIKEMEDMKAKYSNDYSMEDDESMSEED
jgi:hypothetical protein